jgi:hypothetical protein
MRLGRPEPPREVWIWYRKRTSSARIRAAVTAYLDETPARPPFPDNHNYAELDSVKTGGISYPENSQENARRYADFVELRYLLGKAAGLAHGIDPNLWAAIGNLLDELDFLEAIARAEHL